MSLRVWLPLTKDLRNQGLDDVTVTTTNTNIFQNEGKLGNKSIDVSGHYAFRVPSLIKKRIFSCSFWYKPIADSSLSSNWRRIIVFDTYTSDGSTTGAIFRLESSYGYQSSSTNYCISIHNNVGEPLASIGTTLGETDGWNKWQHITITADGVTLKCYRNGVQVASGAMNNGGMLQGTVHIGYSGNRPIGRLNDFRLYDHCLSPLEVKQISQGLILHYPLNRNGWGQENLVNNSDFSNLATTGTVVRDETVLFHGHPTCKISRTGATSNTYTGWSSQDLLPRLTPGTKVTASVWIYRESTHEIDSGCEWRMYQRYNNGASTDWTGFYSASDWPIGEWKRFTHTYTVRSNISGAFLNFNVVKNGTYWLAEPKVEIGEKATNWSPSITDALSTTMGLNETIEYDRSGYCNNGEYYAYDTNGSISYTSDTPKYNVSTHIASANPTQNAVSGTRYLYGHCQLTNPTQMSVAFWLKPITGGYGGTTSNGQGYFCTTNYEYGNISVGSDYQDSAMNHRDGTVNMNDSASTTQCRVTFYPTIGEWHHYVYTYDGQEGRGYKDGVKIAVAQFSDAKTLDSFIGVVIGFSKAEGVWRRNDACYSDFRVYATALSVEDVKSLYQNSAYIDNQGNIYGAIYEEV